MLGLRIHANQIRMKQSCSGQILDFQVVLEWLVRHLSHLALFRLLVCKLAQRGAAFPFSTAGERCSRRVPAR